MIKKFFHMVVWGVLVAAVIFALIFVEQKHNETICEHFKLNIVNPGHDDLTDAASLTSLIITGTDTLAGKSLAEISPYDIHLILDKNPYVKYADVQTGIDGKMEVNVTLRQAVVRIMNKDGVSYYIDHEGRLMPISPGFPSRVLIINGNIRDGITGIKDKRLYVDSLSEGSVVRKLFKLAQYIYKDEFLNKLITQVWMDGNRDLELIPLIGEHTIKFGDFSDMEDKFEKLTVYYREGAGKAGWIDYRSIDLRYKNQVICSK